MVRKEDFTTHKFAMLCGIVGLAAGMIINPSFFGLWKYFIAAVVYVVVFAGCSAMIRVAKGKFIKSK